MRDDKRIEILLVEDSEMDVRLIKECLKDAAVTHNISHVPDGEAALAFLHRGVQYADAPRPDLVILDLNLPKMSGMEVLEAAKADHKLKSIPVIVLTSSAIAEDVHRAYDLQASCYLSKPLDLDGFADLVKKIEDYWLHHVQLPKDGAADDGSDQ